MLVQQTTDTCHLNLCRLLSFRKCLWGQTLCKQLGKLSLQPSLGQTQAASPLMAGLLWGRDGGLPIPTWQPPPSQTQRLQLMLIHQGQRGNKSVVKCTIHVGQTQERQLQQNPKDLEQDKIAQFFLGMAIGGDRGKSLFCFEFWGWGY